MKITVVRPAVAHSAYGIAADTFAELAERVLGAEITALTDDEYLAKGAKGSELVVLVGNDAVNSVVADLYLSMRLEPFGIRYCTDDYLLRTVEIDGTKYLIFAGGRPRSAIYAVYRYFELFCDCRWFWDGDRLTGTELKTEGIDLVESPRFDYRGLRYFAHRSLHRFQAEHWSLEDWQREIDWILKKRLNMFMLRIGMDDVWQKAFPELVPYPPLDEEFPSVDKDYNDRSLFWSLQYRGELRKKILQYAFERDLIHPEDCGTMTHWYSQTPLEFLEKAKPSILPLSVSQYNGESNMVWDVRDRKNVENYFKLTEAHVKVYGKPEMFHTIGLGERMYSKDREVNKRMKLYVYHLISNHIKEKYPNAPLLIASWDLWMRFTPEEVQALVADLDPSQAIIFDYTSETLRKNNFTQWGVINKFPWIFGLFSGYEANSEIRGAYSTANERIEIAKADPMCKGFVFWPELSHGDTFAIEYFADNAWSSETLPISEHIEKYCKDRYPAKLCEELTAIWKDFMPIVELTNWSTTDKIHPHGYDIFPYIMEKTEFKPEYREHYENKVAVFVPHQDMAIDILRRLANIPLDDEMTRRDVYDIARTVVGRYINSAIFKLEALFTACAPIEEMEKICDVAVKLMEEMTDILGTHEDFSLLDSLNALKAVTEVNPNFERTFKNNASNTYCRSYIYENAAYLYLPEMKALFAEIKRLAASGEAYDRQKTMKDIEPIRASYYDTPIAEMKRDCKSLSECLLSAARLIGEINL